MEFWHPYKGASWESKTLTSSSLSSWKDWPNDVQMESNEKGGEGGGGSFNDLLNEKATMIKDNVIMLRSWRHVDDVE